MRLRIAVGLLGFLAISARGADDIRAVDFQNFNYPWTESMPRMTAFPDSEWGWFTVIPHPTITVEKGMHDFIQPGDTSRSGGYLAVRSVAYGDLDGDGQEEAAIDLRYGTGGTMNWYYLYVYGLQNSSPKTLGLLQSGTRADGGLVGVAIENGLLVLDFNDSAKRGGDCCSKGFIRVHYRWQNNGFVEIGNRAYDDFPNSDTNTPDSNLPSKIRSSEDVERYEAKLQVNPEDLEGRKLLLEWYFGHVDDPAAKSIRLDHILWTIENHPDLPLTGTFLDSTLYDSSILEPAPLLIDEREVDAFRRIRGAWLEQVDRQPTNNLILYRAAIALSRSDPELAAKWFKQVIRSDSGARVSTARQLLGRLYADAIMGLVARTPSQFPAPIPELGARPGIAEFAKQEVEASNDGLIFGEAGYWLHKTCVRLGLVDRQRPCFDPLALDWLIRAERFHDSDELISMYEEDLYRDQHFGGLPVRLPRIELKGEKAPTPLNHAQSLCESSSKESLEQRSVPVTLIIAPDGRVRFAYRGYVASGGLALAPYSKDSPVLKSALKIALQYQFPVTYVNGKAVEVETTVVVAVCNLL